MSPQEPEGGGRPRWPVSLLTGMLGSGKTTLLRRLLGDPALNGTAVLINEIGEIGLDHHLIERIDGETVLLAGGCLCCTLRADLPQTLGALRRRWLGEGTLDLRRVIVETTGLADPGPILVQLATHPLIASDFPLARVVTTVDAQHAATHLAARPEARRQIAVADQIVLTKTDIVDDASRQIVESRLGQINAAAPVIFASAASPDIFLASDFGRGEAVRRWRGSPRPRLFGGFAAPAPSPPHDEAGIGTLSLWADTALNWPALLQCLAALIAEFAPDLLRLKGILNVAGRERPIVVHAVHDAFYPLDELAAWPDDDHRSRLVLIVEGLGGRRARLLELVTATGIDWHPVG